MWLHSFLVDRTIVSFRAGEMVLELQAEKIEEIDELIRVCGSMVRLLLEYGADANAAYE